MKSSPKEQQIQDDNSDSDTENSAHAMAGTPPKPWNPLSGLKFPCPLGNHKHEMSFCAEFFNLTPLDRWDKIEKNRMCYSCLKPKTVCKGKKMLKWWSCPELLKCTICVSWAESKGLSPFSIFLQAKTIWGFKGQTE